MPTSNVAIILPIQPSPTKTAVAPVPPLAGAATAVARSWSGDDYMRCNLCPSCQLRTSPPEDGATAVCLVVVSGEVKPDEAPLFRAREAPAEAPARRIFGDSR